MTYKYTTRYTHGWVSPKGVFGSSLTVEPRYQIRKHKRKRFKKMPANLYYVWDFVEHKSAAIRLSHEEAEALVKLLLESDK